MTHETIRYQNGVLKVRGGAWLDYMNSCFYRVIDKTFYEGKGYNICLEGGEDVLFALPNGDREEIKA